MTLAFVIAKISAFKHTQKLETRLFEHLKQIESFSKQYWNTLKYGVAIQKEEKAQCHRKPIVEVFHPDLLSTHIAVESTKWQTTG